MRRYSNDCTPDIGGRWLSRFVKNTGWYHVCAWNGFRLFFVRIRFYCYSDYDIVIAFMDFNFHFLSCCFFFLLLRIWSTIFMVLPFSPHFVVLVFLFVCRVFFFFYFGVYLKSGHSCMRQPVMHQWAWRELSKYHCDCTNWLCECGSSNEYLEIVISILLNNVFETSNVRVASLFTHRNEEGQKKEEKEEEQQQKNNKKKITHQIKLDWFVVELTNQISIIDRSMDASFGACEMVTLQLIAIRLICYFIRSAYDPILCNVYYDHVVLSVGVCICKIKYNSR